MNRHTEHPVVIVGGRCAGSATAIALGRLGYPVLLLERSAMPSDTLSTHLIWPDGIAVLDRLGVLGGVLATGAPPLRHFELCHGTHTVQTTLLPAEGYDFALNTRRLYLDGILWDAAATPPGVTVCDRAQVTNLLWEDGRASGVEFRRDGKVEQVSAALVVGADGRNSFVAGATGAVEDDIVPAGRYWYYAYFNDAQRTEPPTIVDSETENDSVIAMPTTDDQVVVLYGAFNEDFDSFRSDHHANYLDRIAAHPRIASMLDGARPATPVYGFAGLRGYYRTAHGPGWVLIGDAAHQKDPITGRGINDALRSAEWLADALATGITDAALETYAQTLRDRTRSKSLNTRMLARPDWYMTETQGDILSREVMSPEGLARFLRTHYSDDVSFEEYFG